MVQYDAVIVGSGLGGLASAIILAKEGWKVCVLEKNNQFGGNLQTFSRDKVIFDTGVHYIGALGEGQNLNRYFKYLEIFDGLNLKKMNEDGFDYITFDDDPIAYPHAQGYSNFVEKLLPFFPEERATLESYCNKIQEICNYFPLYNLSDTEGYPMDILSINVKDYLDQLTDNEKLKTVLSGSNFLYAGSADKSPLYVHALSVNSYIQSSWKVVRGGSQITKQLVRVLKKYGGTILKYKQVKEFCFEENKVKSVKTVSGEEFFGRTFISNVDIKATIGMVGKGHFRKAFVTRIGNLKPNVSAFSLYMVLKPEKIKFFNYNIYNSKSEQYMWTLTDYTEESWPLGYMLSVNSKTGEDEWAESMTAVTYLKYEDVKQWEETLNTVADKAERGVAYENFKKEKTEKLIVEIEKRYPNIRECIQSTYTSTPLSFRDYIGIEDGSLYGYERDSSNPLMTFIAPKSKIENVFFTGQSINMHGILGVTIGAVSTCSEILGKSYLLQRINEEV